MLDMAGINSWVIYKKVTGSTISRRASLFELISELIGVTSSCDETNSSEDHLAMARPSVVGLPTPVLSKRKHCSSDDCKNMTSTICSICQKLICGTCTASSTKYVLASCNRH